MNAETERRLAAMIMEEANMMRQRAERDGVGAYLAKPVVKGALTGSSSRARSAASCTGLTAESNRGSRVFSSTHLTNRVVDMEEMWRQRELENKASRDKRSRHHHEENPGKAERDEYAERRHSNGEAQISSSSDQDDDDNGLKDEDIEKFLHSKVKRGRGAVGSRMDEPGPYRARLEGPDTDVRLKEDWEARIAHPIAGPSLPPELSGRESKKRKKEKSIQVDGSDRDNDVGEVKERKRRHESKKRARKKEKRKSKDSEKHSMKKKRR